MGQVEFMGETTLVQLDLAGRTITVQTDRPLSPGEAVDVSIGRREGVVLVEEER